MGGARMSSVRREPVPSGVKPILTVRNVVKRYQARTDIGALLSMREADLVTAVDGVSFELREGEVLGLVGESGSGKTTLGRLLVRLEVPDKGEVYLDERSLAELRGAELKKLYRHVQMIFQDPYESLNPRFTSLEMLMDPVKVQQLAPKAERVEWIERALERAGLAPARDYLHKYPHELSGGQRQRLAIARALVMEPRVLVADEPVSMLDVSIKAGVLNLLKSFAEDDGMTIVYISHDLSTVKYLCHRIAIMFRGRFVEVGPSTDVIDRPQHPYAQALKAAVPRAVPGGSRERVRSSDRAASRLPVLGGCRYRTQCPEAMEHCAQEDPTLRKTGDHRFVACHLY